MTDDGPRPTGAPVPMIGWQLGDGTLVSWAPDDGVAVLTLDDELAARIERAFAEPATVARARTEDGGVIVEDEQLIASGSPAHARAAARSIGSVAVLWDDSPE